MKTAAANAPWYIVSTYRHREGLACDHAARQGCQCFLPLIYDEATHRDSVFFPGYLFLRPPTPSIRFLDSTIGVTRVLRFGESPAVIRDSELRALFNRTEVIGGVRALRVALPRFRRGQQIRVRCGALEGNHVEFQRYRPGSRVEILVEFLGRKAAFTLPGHWVEAA